jgi:hypothetical protein
MKNKLLLIITLILMSTAIYSESIVYGYYITKSNDTVHSKIVIKTVFDLHDELTIIDSLGKRHNFNPNDINGFSFTIRNNMDFSKSYYDFKHDDDGLIKQLGFEYIRPTFDLDGEIHSNYFFQDSIWTFLSCKLSNDKRIFLKSLYGNGGFLQANQLFWKFDENTPWYTLMLFLVKDGEVVGCNNRYMKEWIKSCVNDDKELTNAINDDIIKAFPFDYQFVIDDYNLWSTHKQDSSLIIKGFVDANKHYNSSKYFVYSCVAGTAFFLPGFVTAVITAHNPKEKDIKIPESLSNKNDINYSKAFKHRAYEKKFRSSAKGAVTGGILSIGLIILLVL